VTFAPIGGLELNSFIFVRLITLEFKAFAEISKMLDYEKKLAYALEATAQYIRAIQTQGGTTNDGYGRDLCGDLGTYNVLRLAKIRGARIMLVPTSEIYGDPLVHPQPEGYCANVNPVGIWGVYDESKRYADAITMADHRHHGVGTRIVRIFNPYGPRMLPDDEHMIPNFIQQALLGTPLTIHGDGSQTEERAVRRRPSRRYLAPDEKSGETRAVNIGKPVEHTVKEVAALIPKLSGGTSELTYEPLPQDDPKQRCPDITRVREVLGWEHRAAAREDLKQTFDWFAERAEQKTGWVAK
jgi:dTDP-glucose 4,6-dehydratase